MKFIIKHEIRGRIRVQACVRRMSIEEADTLQYYLDTQECVISAKIQRNTLGIVICYTGSGSRCSHSFGTSIMRT